MYCILSEPVVSNIATLPTLVVSVAGIPPEAQQVHASAAVGWGRSRLGAMMVVSPNHHLQQKPECNKESETPVGSWGGASSPLKDH